jgi:hypothetical protein
MKVETNSPLQNILGSDTGIGTLTTNRVLDAQALLQGETVTSQPPQDSSGTPEIPSPDETASVGTTSYGGDQVIDIKQLLMWVATMAAEYIKQQNELLKTRQKAVEGGFKASMDAAQNNYDKNMTQAIVGIVGASVSLAGAGFAGFKLTGAGKEIKGLGGMDKATIKEKSMLIDHSTQIAQTANAVASGTSQGSQSIAGTVSADQEYDAKADEALAQLIAKTAESITSNEGSTRQIIEKFANDLMALLKNFAASTTR